MREFCLRYERQDIHNLCAELTNPFGYIDDLPFIDAGDQDRIDLHDQAGLNGVHQSAPLIRDQDFRCRSSVQSFAAVENPGVDLAITDSSTSSSIGVFLE